MNSLDLTKQSGVKAWRNPSIIITVIFFIASLFVGAILGTILLYPLLKTLLPEYGVFLNGLYSFGGILVVILLVNKYYNKRPITALGFHKKEWFKRYLQGILLGLIMLGVIVGIASLMGNISLNINPHIDFKLIFLMMLGFMIQGMT